MHLQIVLHGSNQGLPEFKTDEDVLAFWNGRDEVARTGARMAHLLQDGKAIAFRIFND